MDELFEDPRALRVMFHLLAKGSPINMREFIFAAEITLRTAKPLRERMEKEWGVLAVGEPKIRTTTEMEIRLTREGEEIARKLAEVHPLFEVAKRKARLASERK